MSFDKKYKKLIATKLDSNDSNIFLYWKGRVALYALLKAMGIGPGDEVILPGFTCVVVPNAIKYLGAKPIYVDIQKTSMTPIFEDIQKVVTDNTKVIICQNSFGLSTQVDQISQWAKLKGIYTLEDCAHGFGGSFKNKPNGTYCDAAFFSTQWNKPFSTGIGGFSHVCNQILKSKLAEVNKDLIQPSIKDNITLKLLLFFKKNFLMSWNYFALRRFYRFLSTHNLTIGSSEGGELVGTKIPNEYFKGMSITQIKEGIMSINKLDESLLTRKKNAKKISFFLKNHNKFFVSDKYFSDHSFLKYPILVKNREQFEIIAEKEKFEIGDWFCSPIHPVKTENNFYLWDLNKYNLPVAFETSKQIVNLSTDLDSERTISFLKGVMNELL